MPDRTIRSPSKAYRKQGDVMRADWQERPTRSALALGVLGLMGLVSSAADAAVRIEGQVQAGGGAVAGSTVTLWAGSGGEPRQLAETKTAEDGSFALGAEETPGPGVSLYVIAHGGVPSVNKSAGDNPALEFLAVLGGAAPGAPHHQRDDDHRVGLDERAVPRRRRRSRVLRSASASPRPTSRTSSTCKPADGAGPFRTRSTAVRR